MLSTSTAILLFIYYTLAIAFVICLLPFAAVVGLVTDED
jgi:hypothetical protein